MAKSSSPHSAGTRLSWLLYAFGPLGDTATQEELDALKVLSKRIVDTIPITPPPFDLTGLDVRRLQVTLGLCAWLVGKEIDKGLVELVA